MIARSMYLLLVLVAAIAIAACGGDDETSTDDAATTTETTATETTTEEETPSTDEAAAGEVLELGVDGDNLAYDKTELTAPAGTVTIRLTNDSSIPHDIVIEGFEDNASELLQNGETGETTVELEPGTYEYYCTPHRAAGMTGTLTIT